jgi:Raf kinase inhibitor-like YbhB/YbcL family protein
MTARSPTVRTAAVAAGPGLTLIVASALILMLSACGTPEQKAAANHRSETEKGEGAMTATMKLTSTAFTHEGTIPVRYTCDGEDLSPPLNWEGAPAGTKAFALVCDDPDAPVGTWDHWLLFNIPAARATLPEGVAADATLEDGSRSGLNSWKRTGYGGPCPPPGKPHRYFFRLYALSAPVELSARARKSELLKAVQPLTLATGTLMGTYGR